MSKLRIVVVDDEENQRELLAGFLRKQNFDVDVFASGRDVLSHLLQNQVDVVLTDHKMPQLTGFELLQQIRQQHPLVEVIIITAYGDIPTAVSSMKEGAYDFITKPVNLEELLSKLRNIHEYHGLIDNPNSDRSSDTTSPIIGNSRAMQELKQRITKVAPVNVPILILGESGTGKELVAQEIHQQSTRAKKELFKINCAAIPESLIESELFGYVKGAFTGADKNKTGIIQAADASTLFLDEIGELPYHTQAKLLRFLQEGEIEPVGSTRSVKVDVRIISATNRNLTQMQRDKRFREDLFYRLNVISLNIPPLRDRKDDIPPLIEYFTRKYQQEFQLTNKHFTPDAVQTLLNAPWYGNVRELENAIRAAMVISYNDKIEKTDLPLLQSSTFENNQIPAEVSDLNTYLESVEREILQSTLSAHSNNQSGAARALNISERALRYKLSKLGLK